jgi:hypothetical protein
MADCSCIPTSCLQCIAEAIEVGDDVGKPGEWLSKIGEAITWAPSWQTVMMSGQMMVSCVAVPSCGKHLTNRQKTSAEKASSSGLWLGGQSPQ